MNNFKDDFLGFFIQIKKDVTALADALELEFADAGRAALPGLQKAELEEIRQRAGGVSWDELRTATQIAYADGYIEDSDIMRAQHRASSSEQLHELKWRQRVLVSQDDLFALYHQTRRLGNVLEKESTRFDWKKVIDRLIGTETDERTARQIAVAEIFISSLQAVGAIDRARIDKHTGEIVSVDPRGLATSIVAMAREPCNEDDTDQICIKKNSFMTFARGVVKLPASLPFDVEGVLALPLGEILKRDIEWIGAQARSLKLKSQGMEWIVNGYSVPEWPAEMKAENRERKNWMFKVETAPTVAYLHIPISYIP